MGKKKKKDPAPAGQRNWYYIAGALIAAVIALALAFMAGRDFFNGTNLDPAQDPEINSDQDKIEKDE